MNVCHSPIITVSRQIKTDNRKHSGFVRLFSDATLDTSMACLRADTTMVSLSCNVLVLFENRNQCRHHSWINYQTKVLGSRETNKINYIFSADLT